MEKKGHERTAPLRNRHHKHGIAITNNFILLVGDAINPIIVVALYNVWFSRLLFGKPKIDRTVGNLENDELIIHNISQTLFYFFVGCLKYAGFL